MSYTTQETGKKKRYNVIEKETQKVLVKNVGYKKSRDIIRSLNLGSGFKDHIPDFFFL